MTRRSLSNQETEEMRKKVMIFLEQHNIPYHCYISGRRCMHVATYRQAVAYVMYKDLKLTMKSATETVNYKNPESMRAGVRCLQKLLDINDRIAVRALELARTFFL